MDTADCATDCSSTDCKTYFQSILWAHDNCDHDQILLHFLYLLYCLRSLSKMKLVESKLLFVHTDVSLIL